MSLLDIQTPAFLNKFLLQNEAVIREAAVFGCNWHDTSFPAFLNCVVECLTQLAFFGTGVDCAPDKYCKVEARVGVPNNVQPLVLVRTAFIRQVAQQHAREQLVERVLECGGV